MCSKSSLHFLREDGRVQPPEAWVWRRNAMRTLPAQRLTGKKQPALWNTVSENAGCFLPFARRILTVFMALRRHTRA